MYGLITRLTAASGRRDELALMLLDPTANRRGCHHYVVALGTDGPDSLWVTEIWISEEAHRAWVAEIRDSEVLKPALALIATWGDTIITRPLAGIGL
jgi:quinol monooxygenase YgiN